MGLKMTVGVDLGQLQDYSAVCVLESVEETEGAPLEERKYLDHRVVHLERFPLGTQYGEIVRRVGLIYRDAERRLLNPGLSRGVPSYLMGLPDKYKPLQKAPELVVDGTGVGLPVLEMFRSENLGYRAVFIHGGFVTGRSKKVVGGWSVAKRELVSRTVSAFGEHRLRIPRSIPFAKELRSELGVFQVKTNPSTGHDSYEAWRERDHDDLVLALSLAIWSAEKKSPTVQIVEKPAGL